MKQIDVGPTLVTAMFKVIVLQAALACLVARRAIDRMIQQQIFFDHRPDVENLFAFGDKDRTIAGLCLTGGDQFRHHRDFAGLGIVLARLDQTHATACHD